MEDDDYVPREAKDFYSTFGRSQALSVSSEIVAVEEDKPDSRSSSGSTGQDIVVNDVYVAVGKDDTDVLKWTINNAVSPGTRIFLVHVFPPITHIPTPVGRLARSQLNEGQVRLYLKSEGNKRKNLLQNYVNFCNDAKVPVETMLLERSETAKGVLDLIPVLRITHLVIGTRRSPHSKRASKSVSMGEFVRNNAPAFCEVTIVHQGKKAEASQQVKCPKTPDFEKIFLSCFPDSAREDEDFLSCISKNSNRDETNSGTMHYGNCEGHMLKFVTVTK